MKTKNKKGFTLVELMIVIAILAILAAIVIFALNPAELFRRARDSQRLSDLRVLSSAVAYYLADATTPILDGSTNTLCTGGTGNDTIFGSVTAASAPTGWTWTGSIVRTTDGAGWLKINFSSSGSSPIGQLPIDPSNGGQAGSPSTMYTFACDTSLNFELNANMESTNYKTKEADDGGDSAVTYEVGTRIVGLLPPTPTSYYVNN